MNPTNKKRMELAMVYSIPMLTDHSGTANGRLKNLFIRLTRFAGAELDQIPKASRLDQLRIVNLIHEFGASTGWERKERHVSTLCSFCLEMIENSQFRYDPRIITTLTDIVDYFDRKGKASPLTFQAGGIAASKWSRIMEAA